GAQMKIILKIAWRNVWRNPRRSLVLITSIAVGVFGYLGTTAFSRGFLEQMVDAAINLHGGHIMITAKGYQDNPNIRAFIRTPEQIEKVLDGFADLESAPLVSIAGMISSSETAAGVSINGVVPERESNITTIAQSILDGQYFSGANGKNEIVIGEALAKKLNVILGEKVVLMISGLDNTISSGAYRVVGIYRVSNPDFEKAFVYLEQRQAQTLAGYGDSVTAFSIRTPLEVDGLKARLTAKLAGKNLEVLSWKDRNKLLELALKLYDFSLVITIAILFTAIAFSIANAFLMVIYERIYELGIMMANGVLPKKIRLMLYFETFFITLLGLALGLLVSVTVLGYWAYTGLDLTDFASGLSRFGVGAIIYPKIALYDIVVGVVVINMIVLASVLYPSFKASRFEVVDAIRFV
ncbi:MAG: ABC transporter permease, partial [bacterium]